MKMFVRAGIYASFLLLTIGNILGQPPESDRMESFVPDSRHIRVMFPFDKAVIDTAYMENIQVLSNLRNIMEDRSTVARLDSIVITASSSPEGTYLYNIRLAERRANAMRTYILQQYPFISENAVKSYAYTDYWGELINILGSHPQAPGRDTFLKILANPDLTNDTKIRKMITTQGGKLFAYLRNSGILARLRRGGTSIEFHSAVPGDSLKPIPVSIPESYFELPPLTQVPVAIPLQSKTRTTYPLALRTNLLLDLLGGPNLAVEIPVGRHVSIAGGFDFAYTRLNNRYALQTKQATLEGRYWFNPRRNLLTGWNVGVYGTYNDRFDVQWKSGWQGDSYWSGGLSAGYSVPIANCFNIDFSAMGGYFYSPEMRRYKKPQDGHLMWQETRYNVSRLMLTQVRVNFVWLLKWTREVRR